MPTVMRFGGIRVMIRTRDHDPPHVHVFSAGAEARFRVDVSPVELLSNKGFSEKATKRIAEALTDRREFLMEKWDEYHGEE